MKLAALLVVVWLGLGGWLGSLSGKLAEVADSGKTAYLPADVESMRVGGPQAPPAIVVYRDIAAARRDAAALAVAGPVVAEDGQAAYLVVTYTDQLRELVAPAYVTGPAGLDHDLRTAIEGIDLFLVLVTGAVILVILIVVYRSPLLPFVVLGAAGTALGVAMGVIYLLGRAGVLSMGAEVQGIFSVLVLGAGTDYALLLVSRFREELQHHDKYTAMRVALRRSVGAIGASAGTVIAALLCLLLSDLGMNRSLGPVGAIGIACAALAMLTFLPAVLVLLGRAAFWPNRRRADRFWPRVARWVDRRPRALWLGTALVLAVLALGVLRLDARGLTMSEQLLDRNTDSAAGQALLSEHFPGGEASPAIVATRSPDEVIAQAERVPGVAAAVALSETRVAITLSDGPDTHAAQDTVVRLRNELPAEAQVGGYTAVQVDFHATAARDRSVIPLILIVVLVLLMVLLRSLVAPLLLMATVALSYLAAVGVSAVVFRDLLGFAGVDSTFPVHTVVFLVALGVDYNIFLMARAREEGSVLRALTATGGVITSAGVVLAATFSALAVMPLVLLVELAFTVAFGVLLDTLVVRSLLVPALSVDVGRAMWWPSRLG